jgi:hypothetical protein
VNIKYLIIISGFIVGSIYSMKNEQSETKQQQLIPLNSLSTVVPYYKSDKQKDKDITLQTLLSSEKYNNIAVYIETSPHSKTKPRLEYGKTVSQETISNALEKKQCFYYPQDHKTFRDMREERWYVPFILISSDSNPSVLING